MNTETLAKHQWLYEQGFEPDMWDDYNSGWSPRLYSKASMDTMCSVPQNTTALEVRKKHYEGWMGFKPYFTESMLWSLLQPVKYYKNGINFYFRRLYFINYNLKEYLFDDDAPTMEDKTLLEYLLDLTIWCVKSGYLKAEVKIDS